MKRTAYGAICPACKTVQDWSGDGILRARISCTGGYLANPHERLSVIPVLEKA